MINGQGRLKRAEEQSNSGRDWHYIKCTFEDGRVETIPFMDAVIYGYGMISLAEILKEPDAKDSRIVEVDLLREDHFHHEVMLLQALDIDTFKINGKEYKSDKPQHKRL